MSGGLSDLEFKLATMAAGEVDVNTITRSGLSGLGSGFAATFDDLIKRSAPDLGAGFDHASGSHRGADGGHDGNTVLDRMWHRAGIDPGSSFDSILETRGNWPPAHWGEGNKGGFFGFDPGAEPLYKSVAGAPEFAAFDNTIVGGAGNDALSGTSGADVIFGGDGNDLLSSGPGTDAFVFSPHFGHDTITDFSTGDLVDFIGGPFGDFAALEAALSQLGDNVTITASASDVVTLEHVSLSAVSGDDFRFF